ncbi:hypothetical protein P3T73_03960 [Kiritimatiellota bacterium B12222]|nr:hypothetical protein P3T73_03960 [Kiritimatiellota bacterium B12222]
MNFAELEKEQKQMVILTVGAVIAVFMLARNLMIEPAKAKAAAAEKIITELEGKLKGGETLLRKDSRIQNELLENAKTIAQIYETELPPEGSRYGWALGNIIGVADEVGVQVKVNESRAQRYISPKNEGSENLPMWIPYNVNVDLFTSFENLKKFLAVLEEKYPYSSVAIMDISARKFDNENHSIHLLIEWPVFRYDKDLKQIQQFAKDAN